jgi:hypothetical protein
MQPARVVPALDEVEDRHPGLGLGGEATPIQELALEGGEEALTEGIVVGVASAASWQRSPKMTEVYWQP